MSLVHLIHLSKRLGDRQLLLDLELEIEKKEILVLLGNNGSGKSTLLRMIAGLLAPDQGEIYFEGAPLTSVQPHQREVGMVFQTGGYYDHLSVRANLELSLGPHSLTKKEKIDRIESMAELLGLKTLMNAFPTELSGGEVQRLRLARGLLRRPKLLMLDEPLNHLDPPIRLELRRQIIDIQSRLGISILYVTHDVHEAAWIADRIAILHEGRIIRADTPERIVEEPIYLEVARFFEPLGVRFGTLGPSRSSNPSCLSICGNDVDRRSLPKEAFSKKGVNTPQAWISLPGAWHIMPLDSGPIQPNPTRPLWDAAILGLRYLGDRWLLQLEFQPSKEIMEFMVDEVMGKALRSKTHVQMVLDLSKVRVAHDGNASDHPFANGEAR